MTRRFSALALVLLLLCAAFATQAQDRSDVDAALQAALVDIGSRAGTPVTPGSYTWVASVPLNSSEIVMNCPAAAALTQNKTYRTVIAVSVTYRADRYQYYFAPDATQLTFCGSTHIVTPTLTFTPVTYTPTPSITPTPTGTPRPNAITCPGFMPSRLAAGEQGRASAGNTLNLRKQPQTDAALIRSIYDTQTFAVLNGPTCDVDGHAWWQVLVSGSTGWVVEGEGNIYYAEPIIPPTPVQPTAVASAVRGTTMPTRIQPSATASAIIPTSTPTFAPTLTATFGPSVCPGGKLITRLIPGPGHQGRVTPGEANNVRQQPASNAQLIGQIPGGATFDVLAGPDCDGFGRAWWEVRYDGKIGWTIEGDNNQYFVEPAP